MSQINIYKSLYLFQTDNVPRSAASIWHQDDLSISKIIPALGKKPNPRLKSHIFYLLTVGILSYLVYNIYFSDHVDLIFFNVDQLHCALLNYTESQSHR